MLRSRRAMKRSRLLEVPRKEKKAKFLSGEHVYVQKIARGRRVILFGVIQFDREVKQQRWVNSRWNTRRKVKYLVRFDETVVQIVAGGRRRREQGTFWVAEGSIHRYTNEEDVARKLLGDDYL